MKKWCISVLRHTVWGFRIVLGLCLIAPIFITAFWFNYTVDRSGYFQGDQFVRDIALMLLDGQNVSGYEQMDERQVSRLLVQNAKKPPNTVALGSSRILQMDSKTAGTNDFFNYGMVGADYMDVLGTFYLMDKAEKLPENIIIGFDPWLLNGNDDALDKRSDKQLFAEFATKELGVDMGYQAKDESDKYRALFSLSYFQGNLEYYFRDALLEKKPSPVLGDIENQITETKRGDGSVYYTKELRNATREEADALAMAQAGTFLRMQGYEAPDKTLLQIYDKFFTLAEQKDVNIILVLTPYHPLLWNIVWAQKADFPGFFETEAAVRALAERHNIPVYGSYNPYALEDIGSDDFYDGLHVRTSGIAKFFPGMPEALRAQQNGELPPALDPLTPHSFLKSLITQRNAPFAMQKIV